jgi:hypothetical protein
MSQLLLNEVRGEQFDTLINFVFHPGTDLESWHTPIDFVCSTLRLYQPHSGPCGLFAVLQAYILLNHKHSPGHSNEEYLIDSVLDVMFRLRRSCIFIFCQLFDVPNKTLLFLSTNDRPTTKKFIEESGILKTSIGALLLAISLICLAGPAKLSSLSLNEPMLSQDGKTAVQFVLLLITGNVADSASDDLKVVGSVLYTGVLVKQEIGYLIQDEAEAHDVVGEPLAKPKELIWVRFLGGHFDAVQFVEGGFRAFDPYDQTFEESILIKPINPIYDRLIAALPESV